MVIKLSLDDFLGWELLLSKDIRLIAFDKNFPFFHGGHYEFLGHNSVYIQGNDKKECAIKLDVDYPLLVTSETAYFIPVNKNVSDDEYIKGKRATYLTKEEKLNLTLELFKRYEFEPIFNDNEIT